MSRPSGRSKAAAARKRRPRRRSSKAQRVGGAAGAEAKAAAGRACGRRLRQVRPSALALDVHLVAPDNLVLRGKDIRPGGPTGTALGDMNITRRRRPARQEGSERADDARRHGQHRARHLRFPGAAVRPRARRHASGSPARATINPLLDITATRKIPNTGVEARIHITGTAAGAAARR